MLFQDLGLHPDILRAVQAAGYETPTPIQAQAIPQIMAGLDVMGAAQTGTGKTAAFTLPILHRLMPHASHSASPARHPVRALVLAPTRELADQIHDNVAQYAKFSPLRSAVVFGGVDMNPQTAELRRGVELLIATPGRLLDHVGQKTVNLSQVEILVLDEADRMLDMGFLPDLQRIVNLLPKARQSLLFSATFSPEIRKLGKTFLRPDPISIEVARRNALAETVTQVFYQVDSLDDKRSALVHLVRALELKQVIVFSNTKIGCGRLARTLVAEGIAAEAIHGDRTQNERLQTLEKFKAGEVQVLVATDVAARGLDIAELPAVINFDLPKTPEDYVHRIGRTGRAGASGQAIALMTADDQRALSDIEKLVKANFKPEALQGFARLGRSSEERPERYGRTDRERSDRSERSRPSAGLGPRLSFKPSVPSDPIFSQPYMPPDTANLPQVASTAQPMAKVSVAGRKPAPKAALLGGARRPAGEAAD